MPEADDRMAGPMMAETDAVARMEDPFADMIENPGDRRARLTRWLLELAVLVVVVGVLAWQFTLLHHQVSNLKTTNSQQQQQLTKLQQDLTNLHNSYTATVTCLESGQAQPSLCLQFVR